MQAMQNTSPEQMMSDSKFYMGYSRWIDDEARYESWDEAVSRVMQMHRKKYSALMTPRLDELMLEAEAAYKDKRVLGAQRALQFGGEQIFKHVARMYNCAVSHADRPAFFNEAMYLLLCGCGVGFSVQSRHISKLPDIRTRSQKRVKVFKVPDSIEGWADAYAVLLSSYFATDGVFPAYAGCQVHFDFSAIRPKGAMISGGFKAPGPDGLRESLIKCEKLLEDAAHASNRLRSITIYDFVMHMSDAVLSGGVRRSATICMFDKDDEEMLNAKTGNWFIDNPQRGRSNNSAMLERGKLTREEWAGIMEKVKAFGEPGFIFTDNLDFAYNPCVEIGMLPVTEDGVSGWQMCNLSEQNGGKCNTIEDLRISARAAAILGTLQAGYTQFSYLSKASQQITEREALIGVSITGWMNNPDVLFNEDNMREAAEIVLEVNAEVADLLGINRAARATCAKPSGNASVILLTASGIHGEHAEHYLRNVQMNKQDAVTALIEASNPKMVEESVWSPGGTDVVISFPITPKEGSIYKDDLMGVKQLEFVKRAQQVWVEAGTRVELCVDKNLRHNISNTISVDNWEEVEQYLFDNIEWFAGVSLLGATGDKDYPQAPFTAVYTAEQILANYGPAAMFASGLIVDAKAAFNGNLWGACSEAINLGSGLDLEDSADLLKRDWVRRALKFSVQYFDGDVQKMTYCLKDCHNLHRWESIQHAYVPVDFTKELAQQSYTEVDSMGAQGCAGGTCEISF